MRYSIQVHVDKQKHTKTYKKKILQTFSKSIRQKNLCVKAITALGRFTRNENPVIFWALLLLRSCCGNLWLFSFDQGVKALVSISYTNTELNIVPASSCRESCRWNEMAVTWWEADGRVQWCFSCIDGYKRVSVKKKKKKRVLRCKRHLMIFLPQNTTNKKSISFSIHRFILE